MFLPNIKISWIKLKKLTFCKLKTSLIRNFVYILQTFRGFCQVHFTILFQNKFSMKIIFYQPVNTHKPKFVAFLVFVCTTASFIAQISSSQKMSRNGTPSGSSRKKVNSQEYAELGEPIKTRENGCLLIW